MASSNRTLHFVQENGIAGLLVSAPHFVCHVAFALEVLMLVFVIQAMARDLHNVRNSWFALFAIFGVVNVAYTLCNYVSNLFGDFNAYNDLTHLDEDTKKRVIFRQHVFYILVVEEVSKWYFAFFAGGYHLVIAINRRESLLHWKRYLRIWRQMTLVGICYGVVCVPVVIGIPRMFELRCILSPFDGTCSRIGTLEKFAFEIWTVSTAAIALAILWPLESRSPTRPVFQSRRSKKFEIALLYHDKTATMAFLVFVGIRLVWIATCHICHPATFFALLYQLSYALYHAVHVISLLVYLPPIRQAFLQFYHVDRVFSRVFQVAPTGSWVSPSVVPTTGTLSLPNIVHLRSSI